MLSETTGSSSGPDKSIEISCACIRNYRLKFKDFELRYVGHVRALAVCWCLCWV